MMGPMIRPPGAGARSCVGVLCLLATLGLLGAAAAAQAQVRVSGRVMSDTSAPVAGAGVVLRTPASDDVVARATSDAAGAFVLEIAVTGTYRVTVERQGFYAIEHQLMTLTPGADLLLTLLPVREHLESLDVTSRGDPSSLSQPSTEQALSGAEAMNVPFNGSHGVKNALRTLPGVVMDGSGGIHVDGARESQTLFILDGFNVGDPLNGGFDPKVSACTAA
jgi:Carboxypeptidase regulatory-like domain